MPLAGVAEIDQAVAAARAALPGWRATPADQRRHALNAMSRLIAENIERLSLLNTLDNGTALNIAKAQNFMAADLFAYNAGWADKGGGQVHDTWPIQPWTTASMSPTALSGSSFRGTVPLPHSVRRWDLRWRPGTAWSQTS